MMPRFYFDIKQHDFDPKDPYNYQTNLEWLALRADRLTASFADKLLVNGKSCDGLGDQIKKTLNKRVMQRYTGWIDDEAASFAERECIRRGIIYEDEAAKWYERHTGRQTVACGFVERGAYLGCSPDRIVIGDDRRLLQIKIPMPENYLMEVMDGGKGHIPQCKMELFVCDYWVDDLLIYSPELGAGKIFPIERDRNFDAQLLSKMRAAIKHYNVADKIIREIKGGDG